jgi:formate hydrogenlyase subunit 4
MNATLEVALKALAYTGMLLFAAPLLEGVMRKVKALIHSRKGPPLVQPYLDLAKLLIKEDLTSQQGSTARFAPPAAFAAIVAAAYFVPFGVNGPAAGSGDLFLFIYMVTLSAAFIIAGSLSSASPFAHLGGSREMMMVLTSEAVIVISLLTVAVSGHTALFPGLAATPFRFSFLIALFCFFFAMQALIGKLPFDIPEADQEIMEGPFIEYSGPSLALLKWTFYMKQLIFGSLFFNLFVGWPQAAGWGWAGSIVNFGINFAAVVVLALFVVLVDATNPRLRIEQSMRFFGGLIAVALVAVGLAALGL